MRNLILFLAAAGMALAQDPATNPQLASMRSIYMMVRSNVLKSADAMPEAKYGYRPTDSVRSFMQQLQHVADAQYFMCSAANGDPAKNRNIEQSNKLKTRAELVSALNEAYAFCDAVYARLSDASSSELVDFIGEKRTKLAVLSFNNAHTMEHYGNIATYLRINGIVPPSSAGAGTVPPATQKK